MFDHFSYIKVIIRFYQEDPLNSEAVPCAQPLPYVHRALLGFGGPSEALSSERRLHTLPLLFLARVNIMNGEGLSVLGDFISQVAARARTRGDGYLLGRGDALRRGPTLGCVCASSTTRGLGRDWRHVRGGGLRGQT